MHFRLWNRRITDSVFLLFTDLHFVHGFHMCCVNFLAYLFVCLLEFWLYICNCSLVLFFATFLRTECLFFSTNNSYLHLVCFRRFLSVVIPRLAQLSFLEKYFFFAPDIMYIYCLFAFLCGVLTQCFSCFFCLFHTLFVCDWKTIICDNLHLVVFDFFGISSCVCVLAFCYAYIYSMQPPFLVTIYPLWPFVTTETSPAN